MNINQAVSSEHAPVAFTHKQTFWPEGIFAALLISIAGYLGLSSFYLPENFGSFIQQACVFFLFVLIVSVNRFYQDSRWANVFRCLFILGIISYLYSALASLAFNNVPWVSDDMLYRFDAFLGMDVIHSYIAPAITQIKWQTELLSITYAAFIPYLISSVFLYGTHKDNRLSTIFLLSIAMLYAISFLGYLFVPAHGPVVLLAEQYNSPINGGFFHALVTSSVDRAGGPHGAFPSIHVGASVLILMFDFRHGNRARAWLYLPVVLLIALATVLLRYHYVVDLIAGLLIAVLAMLLAERWIKLESNK